MRHTVRSTHRFGLKPLNKVNNNGELNIYKWTNNTWMLHHDNAPAHVSLLIREFLTKHETTVAPQPPYSPDLAPADFFLFPNLKSSLKGRRFQKVEEIEENSIRDLRAIPQNTFQDEFQNCKKRRARCIESGGEHFEEVSFLQSFHFWFDNFFGNKCHHRTCNILFGISQILVSTPTTAVLTQVCVFLISNFV